jgi:hypothetical protein
MNQLYINNNINILTRIGLSILLLSALSIKLYVHWSWNIGFTLNGLFNLVGIIFFLIIIWNPKPFFWYFGLVLFSIAIYYSFEYEIYHNSSNIPPIVPTKDIYYFLQRERSNKLLCNLAHYFPYFCFVIFLFLFIFNKSVKKYYRII